MEFYKQSLRFVAFALTVSLAGCRSAEKPHVPDWRIGAPLHVDDLGRVGVALCAVDQPASFPRPQTRFDAAAGAASELGFRPLVDVAPSVTGEGAVVLIALVYWIPAGIVVGGTYGAVVGVDEDQALEAAARLTPVAEYPWIERIRADLMRQRGDGWIRLEQRLPGVPKASRKETLRERWSPIPRIELEDLDLSECKRLGINTLLILNWERYGLAGDDEINPTLSLRLVARATCIRVADRQEIGVVRAYYNGGNAKRLLSWSQDPDAFEAELELGSQMIAAQINEWLDEAGEASKWPPIWGREKDTYQLVR